MWMAIIYGYDEVVAFSKDQEKAKEIALRTKYSTCKDDLTHWTWEEATDYYGTSIVEVTEGTKLHI